MGLWQGCCRYHKPLVGSSEFNYFAAGLAAGAAAGAAAAGAPGAPGLAATLRSPEWPWKVRVGANSPILWPTMFSVTNTGTNFLPWCTANVSPTISGSTVERRDQVLMTFLDLVFCASSVLARTCLSTNGPFLIDLAICV